MNCFNASLNLDYFSIQSVRLRTNVFFVLLKVKKIVLYWWPRLALTGLKVKNIAIANKYKVFNNCFNDLLTGLSNQQNDKEFSYVQ